MSKIEEALKKALIQDGNGENDDAFINKQLISRHRYDAAGLDSRVASTQEIAKMGDSDLRNHKELATRKIIFSGMKDVRVVNQFRELRTKILQMSLRQCSSVLVTSISGNNGNSFVSLNLATAFSFDEAKTALLVDCNFSQPGYQELIQSENSIGLSDFIEQRELTVDQIIYQCGIKRLRIIPAGSRREITSEYFTTIRMKQVLDDIHDRYQDRIVILDSPPVLESADTQILMDYCDQVILVVPYGKVTQGKISAAVKRIGEKKLLGVVFNNEPRLPGAIERRLNA